MRVEYAKLFLAPHDGFSLFNGNLSIEQSPGGFSQANITIHACLGQVLGPCNNRT